MLLPSSTHPRTSETLRLVEEFLNTQDLRTFQGAKIGPHGAEEIGDARALVRWLAARRLVPRACGATEADVRRAHALRAQLRAALVARATTPPGMPPTAGPLGQLHLRVGFDESGEPELLPVDDEPSIRSALATIASRVAFAAIRGEWSRLRICAAPDCGWVFYDRSKAGTGRWCSMRVCGNRLKTRAYRASLVDD